jgi:hypothetical protein
MGEIAYGSLRRGRDEREKGTADERANGCSAEAVRQARAVTTTTRTQTIRR